MSLSNWILTKAKFWKDMPPPSRPWPSEVKWFEKYIKEFSEQGKKDLLILGATVEFRSVAHQYGMNVHLVDFSQEFVNIISEQPMKYGGPETVYIQNWLSMDLGKQFDLILGDWIPGVLQYNQYEVFFTHLVKHMKIGGLFIDRPGLRPNSDRIDLHKIRNGIIEHYEKYTDKCLLYTTICDYFYAFDADTEHNTGNLDGAKEAVASLYKDGLIKKQSDYEFLQRELEVEGANASVMIKEEFEKRWLEKYFTIQAIHYGDEHTAPWHPIYVLRKL